MNRNHWNDIFGVAIVLALTVLAAWPFLAHPGLPRDTDAELHVFRAAQMGEALRGGAGYVRWAPDLWLGYGYPIFNYYSPLTYYLANLIALAGLDIVTAVKAVFILGLLAAAAGMYVFVRANWGERAGVVAAAAYVFSPYLLFIDPHMRGDLAEFFALALFPWLLWALEIRDWRWEMGKRQSSFSNLKFALGVVLWAALILSHALMALILSAILVAWVLWQLSADLSREAIIRHWSLVIGHLLLVLGLSAIYWLPFVLERNAVHLSVVGPGQFDFHNHFVAWRDLFAASATLDLGATAPRYLRNLGLAQWVLALLAVPAILLRGNGSSRSQMAKAITTDSKRPLLFFGLCSIFVIFLMLSPSAFIWEHLPLMPFIQFPWRLLGPAAATLAVCAGASTQYLIPNFKWAKAGITVTALLAILSLALPTMYPPTWSSDFGPTTPRSIIGVEQQGRWLGTTSTGDFIPSTVKSDPPANADLIASYERGTVDKFDHSTLPQGASVAVIEHGPTRDQFTVTSPQPFTARALTFDFPGWRATVDGQLVPITPSDPHGLIEFPIPAGQHDVRVELGSTLPRTVGTVATIVTLLVLAWLIVWQTARRKGQAPILIPNTQDHTPDSVLWLALVTTAVFGLVKVGFVDRCETCFRFTSPPGQALAAQYKIDARATPSDEAHAIALLGFDLPQSHVRAGDSFPLTLYWKATAPVSVNYQVFVHLVGPSDRLWGQPLRDKLNPGDFPTTWWPLDKYVLDDYTTPESVVRVKPDAPPGEYEIAVGLYTLADGARAPVFDANGNYAGDSIVLPVKVQVRPK